MREIKFRAKRPDNGIWVYGVPVYSDNECWIVLMHGICCVSGAATENMHVDIKTVGQFTGLQDKNGQDIYEGDLLDFDSAEWGSNELCERPETVPALCMGDWPMCGGFDDVEDFRSVVGNIHDNPELLENNNER